MRILIAEDDHPSRIVLTNILTGWNHEVLIAENGTQAWDIMRQDDAPMLAVLDWMMPEMDGLEVCRLIRLHKTDNPPYIIILSARDDKSHIIQGLDQGANDYLTKPVDAGELRARIEVGIRMVELQSQLAEKIQELKSGSNFLNDILNSIQDGISVMDKHLNILLVNRVMNDWYKNSIPLEGKKCYQAYHNRDEPCPVCPGMQSFQSGKAASAIVPGPAGSEMAWLELFSFPTKDHKTGESMGMVEFVRDVTQQKKLQTQLFQAQKMESVGNLAGGVAHDFNNMLQAMAGNIELLLQGKSADHPDAARLSKMNNSITRAARLVKQLLLFSRKADSRKVRVNLNYEVERVAEILERTIPKMVFLELLLDDSIWEIQADPTQIEQILLNLVGNAADAMPDGGRLLIETNNTVFDEEFVEKNPGSSPGCHILLSVSDTGCGMDKETIKHIFDPFFTTKEVGKGTGLGLASVYGIVKSHGGYIQCYSEPGQGTAFKIFLPARNDKQPSNLPRAELLPDELRGGNENILVVDDESEIRELTREILESFGYSVLDAKSGEQAMEIYREYGKNIDLTILDLNMPGMGGQRCLQEIMKINPWAKVLIASGYSANVHGKEALSSGASGFIGKPYQIRELAAKVRDALCD